MVNFGCTPTVYRGWLLSPLTASAESGQSSPSLSTGGGCTDAVGVGAGGGLSEAGGTTGVLPSGSVSGCSVTAAPSGWSAESEQTCMIANTIAYTTSNTAATIPIYH